MKYWLTQNGTKVFQLLGGRSNVFLLQFQSLNILVDTSTERLLKRLQKRLKQLSIHRIDYLILTHTHFDHAANASFITNNYGARVIVHESESENISRGKNILPQGTTPITRFLIDRFGERYLNHFDYKSCNPDVLVSDRYSIPETNNNIWLMHTPGHTKGCISVIVDNELAIVGDAMFGVFPGSIFPPYGNNIPQIILSWGKLLETSCRLFIPAHGSANKRELVQKCYNHRKQKNT